MKSLLSTVLLGLGLITGYSHAMEDMPMPATKMDSKKSVASSIAAKGVVVSVNKQASNVTLQHEAIPAIEWPAMTMNFKVKTKSQLDTLKKGDKVEFRMVPEGNSYIIESIK